MDFPEETLYSVAWSHHLSHNIREFFQLLDIMNHWGQYETKLENQSF